MGLINILKTVEFKKIFSNFEYFKTNYYTINKKSFNKTNNVMDLICMCAVMCKKKNIMYSISLSLP